MQKCNKLGADTSSCNDYIHAGKILNKNEITNSHNIDKITIKKVSI